MHYIAGVGTRKDEHYSGGVFGRGISDKIIDAYSFIVSNYDEGDEIFLFGFSRGAFTARSIAGLIHNIGVLKRSNLPLVAEAYKHYRHKAHVWRPKGEEARNYRRDNCVSGPTRITFLGLWDTVGALGAPYGIILGFIVDKLFKTRFHDVKLSESVDSAYHAMAVDERRWSFRPTRIELTEYHEKRNKDNLKKPNGFRFYEQKWFPGVHSNVGGGYDEVGLSDCALEWMAERARKNGLNVKELTHFQFATGRVFGTNLEQKIKKNQKLYYRVLTTLLVKLPSLIRLVPVYLDLAKYITWTGDYIRPIPLEDDVSAAKKKMGVDPDYNPTQPQFARTSPPVSIAVPS